jgi:hypothetical protein
LPTPLTTTCRSARSVVDHRRLATAFMACRTPYAVAADGSPEPPNERLTPVTDTVSRRTRSMSSCVVPTSSAVM